ncbi:hypothetical protein IPG41_06065 [Candidatus Peregrinibacteria bacterium]|nr:MAG: hypothetical protein IPG41_06065 [Candidatus Peregrinibacteria bacterium]
MTAETPRDIEIPSSVRDRLRYGYSVIQGKDFLLEDGLDKGQLQEMEVVINDRTFRLTIGKEGEYQWQTCTE